MVGYAKENKQLSGVIFVQYDTSDTCAQHSWSRSDAPCLIVAVAQANRDSNRIKQGLKGPKVSPRWAEGEPKVSRR